jgi:hypothetical protein
VKVLAIVSKYPPVHCAGAEVMLHAMLRDLVGRGHEATVAFPTATDRIQDGVHVVKARTADLSRLVADADVVISHLDVIVRAARVAGNRPLVQILHNDRQPIEKTAPLVVVNSEWIAEKYRTWKGDMAIVRPPVWIADYETSGFSTSNEEPKRHITLLNLTTAKGGRLFWQLAEMMPERRFLAVHGAYGDQIVHRRPNVEVLAHTPHVAAEVYSRTRVLLVPSQHESWGRVAIEAACSGIPVIAHPTPGLVEALGPAGIFADRRDPTAWQHAIDALDDQELYDTWAARVRDRAVELEAICRADLDAFHGRLGDLVTAYPRG